MIMFEIRSILALAGLTFKEAVRSKLFIFVLIFSIAAIIASTTMESVTQEDSAKLARQNTILIITSTSIILSIFLCAFGIPFEIESKRILVVLSKPISRSAYFISKWLGYIFVILVVLLILSITGLVVTAISESRSSGETSDFFTIRESFLPDRTNFYGDTFFESNVGIHSERAIILADMHNNSVVFRYKIPNFEQFKNLDETLHLQITARIRIRTNREMSEQNYTLKVRSADDPYDSFIIQMKFKDPFRYRIELPLSVFSESGECFVTMEFFEYPYSVLLTPTSVRILGASRSFIFSYTKVLIVEFGKVLMILTIVVFFSAVFSPYTSILGGLMGWFFSNSVSNIPQMLENLQRQYEFSLQRAAAQGSGITWEGQLSGSIIKTGFNDVLLALSRIMPDFNRFDINWKFIEGLDTKAMSAIAGFSYFFIWSLIFVFLGYIFFKFVDFK